MKKFFLLFGILFSGFSNASIMFLQPDVVFTTRIDEVPPIIVDDTNDLNGFLGLLSNFPPPFPFIDRTFIDFDLSSLSAVSEANIAFELSNLEANDVVTLSIYQGANGIAEAADFDAQLTTLFDLSNNGFFLLDITDVFNNALGGFLGFAFTVGENQQASLGSNFGDGAGFIDIDFTPVTNVPEPTPLILLLTGVLGVSIVRRRSQNC
jgi:hypothetical protein